jgi:phosphinothricin acetyltransferase
LAETGVVALPAAPPVTVRPARTADNAQIAAIWNREVVAGTGITDTEPRTSAAQRAWLARHGPGAPVIVAAAGDEILAFGALAPYRSKAAFRRTAEDSVYVRPDAQRRGLGGLILATLLDLAREHGYHSVVARVVADNHASRELHVRQGFRLVGIERETAFKHERWLDVVILQRFVDSAPWQSGGQLGRSSSGSVARE